MSKLFRVSFVSSLFFTIFATISLPARAADIFVSPKGNDANNGNTSKTAFRTIQHALETAVPGDTIKLASGTYMQDLRTQRAGTEEKPITISGPADAVFKGVGSARIIEINHNYITLEGFTVDGLWDDADSAEGYRDKLIYVQGKGKRAGVKGLKILNMHLQNAGGECVRLRYFIQNSEIAFNSIKNCGVHDFKFGGMKKKNGEGIYIGTAPEQIKDKKNPTPDIDRSSDNWIHHNEIDTKGNECVAIKEGATRNIVENNYCTGQKDPESAGLDSRGNGNIFRYNQIEKNVGAGVRLGGDTSSYGIDNDVYGNQIQNNAGGGIKFQTKKQGQICENVMEGNRGGNSVGSFGKLFSPTRNCAE